MLAHVKELVAQNHAKYCALGRRPTFCRRTEAQREPRKSGVWQRTVRRAQPELFRSEFSLLIVDECHRISDDDDSQYQQILTHLKR